MCTSPPRCTCSDCTTNRCPSTLTLIRRRFVRFRVCIGRKHTTPVAVTLPTHRHRRVPCGTASVPLCVRSACSPPAARRLPAGSSVRRPERRLVNTLPALLGVDVTLHLVKLGPRHNACRHGAKAAGAARTHTARAAPSQQPAARRCDHNRERVWTAKLDAVGYLHRYATIGVHGRCRGGTHHARTPPAL